MTAAEPLPWETRRIVVDAELLDAWLADPDADRYVAGDADVFGSVGPDDDAVRFCRKCERPRLGTFGEFFAYEPMTRHYPGQSAGTSWTCGECDETYECDFDRSI